MGNGQILPTTRFIGRIANMKLPVLIMSGNDDRIVPTQDSVELGNIIPNVELEILKDCGQFPQEEFLGEFLTSVVSFIQVLN